MSGAAEFLRVIFTSLVYPGLVLGVFGFISFVIADFVLVVSGERRIRRLVAAALPLTVVVFALVPAGARSGDVQALLEVVDPWARFGAGALLGILGLAIGRVVARWDAEVAAAIYVLFLSAVGSFLVYCLVEGALSNLHVFLLGLVLGGGLHVVFRGAQVFPRIERDSGETGDV